MTEFADFHDGYVDGIVVSGEGEVTLRLRTRGGRVAELLAHGVERLRVDGFRLGNVILSVTVKVGAAISRADVQEVYDEAEPGGEGGWVEEVRQRAEEKGMVFLEIAPSYGAICLVLTERVELVERE